MYDKTCLICDAPIDPKAKNQNVCPEHEMKAHKH